VSTCCDHALSTTKVESDVINTSLFIVKRRTV